MLFVPYCHLDSLAVTASVSHVGSSGSTLGQSMTMAKERKKKEGIWGCTSRTPGVMGSALDWLARSQYAVTSETAKLICLRMLARTIFLADMFLRLILFVAGTVNFQGNKKRFFLLQ